MGRGGGGTRLIQTHLNRSSMVPEDCVQVREAIAPVLQHLRPHLMDHYDGRDGREGAEPHQVSS